MDDIFLVIVFGGIECGEGNHLGDDLRLVVFPNFLDLGLNDLFFRFVTIEGDGTVLSSFVGPLSVEFCRIHTCEESGHERCVRDLRRVIIDLYRLGVAGRARGYLFIIGMTIRAAGVTGNGIAYPCQALEDDLGVPETAFREIGYGLVGRRFGLFRYGNLHLLGLSAGDDRKDKRENEDQIFIMGHIIRFIE
jgi:hypothetical protein